MSKWAGSDRRSRLPANWPAIRVEILKRDGHRCTWLFRPGQRCPKRIDLQVDHIIPNDDHSPSNLRTLCETHHNWKSAREGVAAKAAKKATIDSKFRRQEAHPGLL